MVTLVAVVVPLALAIVVQKFGERLGWSAKVIFGAGFVVMWLIFTWAGGDIINRYQEYLTSRRRP